MRIIALLAATVLFGLGGIIVITDLNTMAQSGLNGTALQLLVLTSHNLGHSHPTLNGFVMWLIPMIAAVIFMFIAGEPRTYRKRPIINKTAKYSKPPC